MRTNAIFLREIVLVSDELLPESSGYLDYDFFGGVLGLKDICFSVQYVAGAAGGACGFRLEWLDFQGNVIWDTIREFAPPTNQIYFDTPESPTDPDERMVIPVSNPGGLNYVRLNVNEVGVAGTPGSVTITISGSS